MEPTSFWYVSQVQILNTAFSLDHEGVYIYIFNRNNGEVLNGTSFF